MFQTSKAEDHQDVPIYQPSKAATTKDKRNESSAEPSMSQEMGGKRKKWAAGPKQGEHTDAAQCNPDIILNMRG